MEIAFSECVRVTDESSVGEVRRLAATVAHRLELDETKAGKLALLATEASRNVLVHGGGGEVVLAGMREGDASVARILALDKGDGIANIGLALSDGYSTAGTMGGGMGAMKRLASKFEVFTGKTGTVVLLEVGNGKTGHGLECAGMAIPYPGERLCGDGWDYHHVADRTVALVVDGLGHGLGAAEAAQEAIATFRRRIESGPGEILSYIHDALKKTRGAVAAVVEIRPRERAVIHAGVGNISAVLHSKGGTRSLVSFNGTLGMNIQRIHEFRAEWDRDSVLVMHSDGLQTRWDLSSYSGLLARHPALIGGTLLRDFRRMRDDASVLVLKAA
jgi:anti-sigma regulatory factor (Ser/Thr protein kinase)